MNHVLQMVAVSEAALLAALAKKPLVGTRTVTIAVPPALLSQRSGTTGTTVPRQERNPAPSSGSRGIAYTLFGRTEHVGSAIEAVTQILQELGRRDPSFFERLSSLTAGRSVNHVARSPEAVHPARPDLRDRVVEVAPGWFLNTVISNRQKKQILKAACEAAGIAWGVDLRIELPNA